MYSKAAKALDNMSGAARAWDMLWFGSPLWIWEALRQGDYRERCLAVDMIIGNSEKDNKAVKRSDEQRLPIYQPKIYYGEFGIYV